jgi:hypothetical protein
VQGQTRPAAPFFVLFGALACIRRRRERNKSVAAPCSNPQTRCAHWQQGPAARMDGCYQAGTQKRMEEATVAKAFLSFFDHTLREDCKPTFFVFFAAYQVIPYAKSKTHSASYFISSGQETSGIQLCLRLVSGDIHVTIRSFLTLFLLFFSPIFCVAAKLNILKSRYKY